MRIGAVAHHPDEWLNAIAHDQDISLTPEATARFCRRPDVVYRPVTGVSPSQIGVSWSRTQLVDAAVDTFILWSAPQNLRGLPVEPVLFVVRSQMLGSVRYRPQAQSRASSGVPAKPLGAGWRLGTHRCPRGRGRSPRYRRIRRSAEASVRRHSIEAFDSESSRSGFHVNEPGRSSARCL